MGQANFVYDTLADAAGIAPCVSIFADCAVRRAELRDDAQGAGFALREVGAVADLSEGSARPLGDAVVIDCPLPDGAALAALSRIDSRAARAGTHLVVSTSLDGLEDVFACLWQSSPEILVNPRRADRIIVLGRLLAQGTSARMRELSETDRMALLRLTEQVNQIALQLERLGEYEAEGGTLRSPGQTFRFGDAAQDARLVPGASAARTPGSGGQGRAIRPPLPNPRLVRRLIQMRRLRGRFLDGALFADPAWDMLLDLTAARVEHVRVSVTSLCIAAGVPPTTALRWISQMTDAGLFQRVEDDTDRRRAFIQLSDKAADAMARYFDEVARIMAARD
ncbi:MarR family transcriptional regulator [Altererythrobacter lauratis]|uniref:MarR family transcriptional regulator n=1 Tax=Alteraurantiacibacter lauratis TaxID=2054627 RepID=A0ABV7EL24_9SPHN